MQHRHQVATPGCEYGLLTWNLLTLMHNALLLSVEIHLIGPASSYVINVIAQTHGMSHHYTVCSVIDIFWRSGV